MLRVELLFKLGVVARRFQTKSGAWDVRRQIVHDRAIHGEQALGVVERMNAEDVVRPRWRRGTVAGLGGGGANETGAKDAGDECSARRHERGDGDQNQACDEGDHGGSLVAGRLAALVLQHTGARLMHGAIGGGWTDEGRFSTVTYGVNVLSSRRSNMHEHSAPATPHFCR